MQCSSSCPTNCDLTGLSRDTIEQTAKHPCYSLEAHHTYARMHLPVAPRCNIGCNYCNRRYDCANESRPGVTSQVLSPEQALAKFLRVREKVENLSVVGIAGPGDALANWPNTERSIELIRRQAPEIVFCLSTNGLLLPRYGPEIVALGIKHVTVTLNTLKPETGSKIYRYVMWDRQYYAGMEAARILLANQLQGIVFLVRHGVAVKLNTVVIRGINDNECTAVAKTGQELGALVGNLMPLIPAPGSPWANHPLLSHQELDRMRERCGEILPQMRHCRQCRADAIGLLGQDRSGEFGPRANSKEPQLPAGQGKGRGETCAAAENEQVIPLVS